MISRVRINVEPTWGVSVCQECVGRWALRAGVGCVGVELCGVEKNGIVNYYWALLFIVLRGQLHRCVWVSLISSSAIFLVLAISTLESFILRGNARAPVCRGPFCSFCKDGFADPPSLHSSLNHSHSFFQCGLHCWLLLSAQWLVAFNIQLTSVQTAAAILAPLTTTIYLPSIDIIEDELQTTPTLVTFTLSAYVALAGYLHCCRVHNWVGWWLVVAIHVRWKLLQCRVAL